MTEFCSSLSLIHPFYTVWGNIPRESVLMSASVAENDFHHYLRGCEGRLYRYRKIYVLIFFLQCLLIESVSIILAVCGVASIQFDPFSQNLSCSADMTHDFASVIVFNPPPLLCLFEAQRKNHCAPSLSLWRLFSSDRKQGARAAYVRSLLCVSNEVHTSLARPHPIQQILSLPYIHEHIVHCETL